MGNGGIGEKEHVADVDANAKLHLATIFDLGVACRHRLLHGHGALNRIHNAAKLRQDAIISGVDHATAMCGEHGKHNREVILQVADGPRLIGPTNALKPAMPAARIAASRRRTFGFSLGSNIC